MKFLSALLTTALVATPALAQEVDPDRMVRPYWWDQPVVEALGRARLEVQPNRAAFSATFVETDRNADEAMTSAVERAKVAFDAIEAVAGDAAIVTTSVTVAPYYEQYRDDDRNLIENERPDKVAGYEARADISVQVTDVALAGRARAATLALGPQDADPLRTYLEETVEMQREAMAVAASDARSRATAMAAASDSAIGNLLVLQEGNGPCLGNWSTRQIARVIGQSPPPPPPAPMAAAPREVVVTGSRRRGADIVITEEDIAALDLPSEQPPQTIIASVCAIYTLTNGSN